MLNLLILSKNYTKDFELMCQISLNVYETMNVLPLKHVAPVWKIMLQQPDLTFRSKFRQKLSQKLRNTDIIVAKNSSDRDQLNSWTMKEAIDILRALRNVIHDYKIWLKVDQLIQNAIVTDPNANKIPLNDLMDTINTLAYKEVQNIDTWQFLSSRFLGKL